MGSPILAVQSFLFDIFTALNVKPPPRSRVSSLGDLRGLLGSPLRAAVNDVCLLWRSTTPLPLFDAQSTVRDALAAGWRYSFCLKRLVVGDGDTRHCPECSRCVESTRVHCHTCNKCSYGLGTVSETCEHCSTANRLLPDAASISNASGIKCNHFDTF